jgi:hypothetical protein
MQTGPESPFELLDPPPGGVERMRARLADPSRVRHGIGFAASSVGVLAALIALLAIFSIETHGPAADNPMLAAPELDRLLGREARTIPLTVERDGRALQIEELPSSDPRVRIYNVL